MRKTATILLILGLTIPIIGVTTAQSASTPAIRFGPSVVLDPFRLGGEPLMDIDSKGNIYISSIIGFSNHTSFLWKSEDGGESFDLIHVDLPALQRPNMTVGGGDSEIIIGPPAPGKTEDTVAFIDLEGLVSFGTGFSFDGGNTFVNDNLFASGEAPGGDRQWGGVWRDPKGVDHYYNFFNGLSSFAIVETTDYGVTWTDWARGVTPTATRSRPGPLFVDKKTGDLLLTWTINDADTGDGGAGFTRCTQAKVCKDVIIAKQPNLNTNNTFATGTMDRAGNLYVAWSGIPKDDLDPAKVPTRIFMSVSRDKGDHWSKPIVATPDVPVASMPSIVAGDAGRVAIAYYGTSVKGDPNFNSGPWYPMLSYSLDALSASPQWSRTNIGEHTNHVNPICTAGLSCAIDPNRDQDRNLIDFLYAVVGPKGEVLVTWNDTAHQVGPEYPKGSPFTMFAKQVSGPSLYENVGVLGTPDISKLPYSGASAKFAGAYPANWRADARSDAPVPRHGPEGPGSDVPSLDSRALWIEPAGPGAMRAVLTLDNGSISVPDGSDVNVYMVWWWSEIAVHYALAEVTSDGIVDCYAGEPGLSNQASPRWATYLRISVPPPSVTSIDCALDPATKRVSFTIPYDAVEVKSGQKLYSVTGSTYHMPYPISGAVNAIGLLPEEVDQTTPFSYVVGSPRAQVAGAMFRRPAAPKPVVRPRTQPGDLLPGTGVAEAPWTATILLLLASATAWRLRRRT